MRSLPCSPFLPFLLASLLQVAQNPIAPMKPAAGVGVGSGGSGGSGGRRRRHWKRRGTAGRWHGWPGGTVRWHRRDGGGSGEPEVEAAGQGAEARAAREGRADPAGILLPSVPKLHAFRDSSDLAPQPMQGLVNGGQSRAMVGARVYVLQANAGGRWQSLNLAAYRGHRQSSRRNRLLRTHRRIWRFFDRRHLRMYRGPPCVSLRSRRQQR